MEGAGLGEGEENDGEIFVMVREHSSWSCFAMVGLYGFLVACTRLTDRITTCAFTGRLNAAKSALDVCHFCTETRACGSRLEVLVNITK